MPLFAEMKLKPLVYGLLSLVPGVYPYRGRGTKGTNSAGYCYSVWLRHLRMAEQSGLDPYPKVVAEIGPGDSPGIGYAALISGCEKYYAFDVVEHANRERNLQIFDELVSLFRNRTDIPGEDAFPKIKPSLGNYDFPADILDENRLAHALEESRIENIRAAIIDPHTITSPIQYFSSVYDQSNLEKEFADMIYSQAVLEHVNDLRGIYKAMHSWLKPGAYMSHQIDFKCHGTANEWNGHWTYSDLLWKIIQGKRPYFLNREPHSTHSIILKDEGFTVIFDKKIKTKSHLSRDDLAPKFRSISEEDLETSGAFIQAVKKTRKSK